MRLSWIALAGWTSQKQGFSQRLKQGIPGLSALVQPHKRIAPDLASAGQWRNNSKTNLD
jgi:hypothetical protein